jgi:hypothetical protein
MEKKQCPSFGSQRSSIMSTWIKPFVLYARARGGAIFRKRPPRQPKCSFPSASPQRSAWFFSHDYCLSIAYFLFNFYSAGCRLHFTCRWTDISFSRRWLALRQVNITIIPFDESMPICCVVLLLSSSIPFRLTPYVVRL